MYLKSVLTKFNFPQEVKEIYEKTGIKELYPPQAQAIEKGVLKGNNCLLSFPTASGKTLIAELAMLKVLLEKKGRCLYVVPLKALASEKFSEFQERFSSLGIKVGMATGDFSSEERNVKNHDILIATAEKVDSLLRQKARWLINGISMLVVDEIHFINDGVRGPTLEILITRIRQLNPQSQLLALSATMSNALDLAKWLGAELVFSDWRPVPLREGVYYNEYIKFKGYATRIVKEEDYPNDVNKLTVDTLRGKGQVLVFVNSRRSAQASARELCRAVAPFLLKDDLKILNNLSKKIIGNSTDSTKICRKLGDVVRCGVAFHHAGLKPEQRKLIEDNFKNNTIKVICSTPTLAAGVNLPAQRAIMRSVKRFESGLGSAFIPISEYKQCAGRAGRPQFDDFGEAVIIAKTLSEQRSLYNHYVECGPEPISSKLGVESALRIHVLASIAGGYAHDVNDILNFISQTFLASQRQGQNLLSLIGNIFDFLSKEDFIEKKGFHYNATRFGQNTSRLYIDPLSSIILRSGLMEAAKSKKCSPVGLLHMLCCCPDTSLLHVGKKDVEEVEHFLAHAHDDLVLTYKHIDQLDDYFFSMAAGKTTLLLNQWIQEEKEEQVCDMFNLGPGDIYRQTENARWLLYAASVIADLFKLKQLSIPLAHLRLRIQYGIKEELLNLIQLKGIGRVRARALFKAGFKNIGDLKRASLVDLSKIKTIGHSVANEIKNQISTNVVNLEAVKQFAAKRAK